MRVSLLAGMALVVGVANPARSDEWSHRYPLQGRPELHVKTGDGSVHVETGDASEIQARVSTEGWRIAPEGVTITESQTGNRVDIEVKLPKGHLGWPTGHRSVSVTVRVPSQADLDVHTGDGSIEVKPVSGRLTLGTGDGSITADGLQGEIHLHSGDGSIRATGLAGRLQADTGDGQMTVRGRFDALDLQTGDGGIDAAAEQGSRVESAWTLRSGDGGITLRLPAELDADLDAHTGDGRIDLDRPVTVSGTISPSAVRGKLGSGGLPLRIQTGDGSIHLLGV